MNSMLLLLLGDEVCYELSSVRSSSLLAQMSYCLPHFRRVTVARELLSFAEGTWKLLINVFFSDAFCKLLL